MLTLVSTIERILPHSFYCMSFLLDIPNTQLGGQRTINISRTKSCRVLTTLCFEYRDIQKIPKALDAAKEEIVKTCPKLIQKEKPFRAMISSFERNHVEATINCVSRIHEILRCFDSTTSEIPPHCPNMLKRALNCHRLVRIFGLTENRCF